MKKLIAFVALLGTVFACSDYDPPHITKKKPQGEFERFQIVTHSGQLPCAFILDKKEGAVWVGNIAQYIAGAYKYSFRRATFDGEYRSALEALQTLYKKAPRDLLQYEEKAEKQKNEQKP